MNSLTAERLRQLLSEITFSQTPEGFELRIQPFGGANGFRLGLYPTINEACEALAGFAAKNLARPGGAAASLGNNRFAELWTNFYEVRDRVKPFSGLTINL